MHFICLKARAKCLFRGLLGRILQYMVGCGEKRSPGELVDFQGSPPPEGRRPVWLNKVLLTSQS